MAAIQSLLFDVFGTLVTVDPDPRRPLSAAYRTWKASRNKGIQVKYRKFYRAYVKQRKRESLQLRRTFREISIHRRIVNTLGTLGCDVNEDDPPVRRAVRAYYEPWLERTRPRADCLSTIRRLRKEYRLAIVSNFVYPPVFHEILRKLKLSALFDAIIVSGEVGYVKPHRRIFTRALTSLRSKPSDAVMIGDELYADIYGAGRLGMKTILVKGRNGAGSRIRTKPTARVERLDQLPAAIADIGDH